MKPKRQKPQPIVQQLHDIPFKNPLASLCHKASRRITKLEYEVGFYKGDAKRLQQWVNDMQVWRRVDEFVRNDPEFNQEEGGASWKVLTYLSTRKMLKEQMAMKDRKLEYWKKIVSDAAKLEEMKP